MKLKKFTSPRITPTKITPVSEFLFRVEQEINGGYWATVHDCPGIPWSDVRRYLPPFSKGKQLAPHLCDWCGQNEKAYLAISDQGKELVCKVCAADVPVDRLN